MTLFSHDLSSRAYHPDASLTMVPTRWATGVSSLKGTVAFNLSLEPKSRVQAEDILLDFDDRIALEEEHQSLIDLLFFNTHRAQSID